MPPGQVPPEGQRRTGGVQGHSIVSRFLSWAFMRKRDKSSGATSTSNDASQGSGNDKSSNNIGSSDSGNNGHNNTSGSSLSNVGSSDSGNSSGKSKSSSSGSSSGDNKSSNTVNPTSSAAARPSSTPGFPGLPPCTKTCVDGSSLVPDNNPRVLYSTSWSIDGPFFQTSHQTTVVGSWVSFTFNGSAITVYGSIPPSNATSAPPTAAYAIDAAPPFVTSEPLATHLLPNQPLFSASQLSSDTHSLVINVTSVQAGSPFSIDFFIVTPTAPITPAAITSASVSPSQQQVVAAVLARQPIQKLTKFTFHTIGIDSVVVPTVVICITSIQQTAFSRICI
ncbi:hypothetical protein B0H10DRAFT_2222917 [Mycena sp. CBHHK59/15]|nr:hypothetical protein B0H10DRAFT_2222917 [Mycena sp. CBHHK59/15]